MALTPIFLPAAISAARDEVWAEYRCEGYRTSAPVGAVFTLVVTQQPTNGQGWQMVLPGVAIDWTFVSGAADDSGTQVSLGANSSETQANLALALGTNPDVDARFSVADSGGVITLTARTPGALPVAFTNTSPVTMAWNEATAGADAVYNPNYTANLQVWVERAWGGGTYEPLPAIEGRPMPADRTVRWDVHLLLKPELGWDWPAYTQTGLLVSRKLQRRYYLAWWEQHGAPPVRKRLYKSSTRLAWYAGSRRADRALMPQVWELIRSTGTATPFLTWLGRQGQREVGPTQHVWLSWYRNRPKVNGQQFTLRAVVHYTDGTSSSAQTLWTDTNGSGWLEGEVGTWNAGFRKNGLHLVEPTKTPERYVVSVHDHTGAAVSEAYNLYVRHTEASELHLEWVNSLGVVESTRCKGVYTLGMRAESEAVERWRSMRDELVPDVEESNRRSLLVGGQRTLQVSTGLMDRSECEALADVLLSPEVRRVDHDRQSRHPLALLSAEMVQAQAGTTEEHLYALNLELLEADAELAWSNRPGMPAVPPPDPGGGEGGEDE